MEKHQVTSADHFCSRKLRRGASINVLGRGGAPKISSFRKPAKRGPTGKGKDGPSVVAFGDRLKMRARRDARRKARVLSANNEAKE